MLSCAIVDVAEEEITRLSVGRTECEVAQRVDNALIALSGLQRGVHPNYDDEWTALFYALWYQQAQVNLCYSVIKQALYELRRPFPLGSLRVLDFGCGAYAMPFAVNMVASEAAKTQAPPQQRIRIYAIDESEAIVAVGKKLWEKFVAHLGGRSIYIEFHPQNEFSFVENINLPHGAELWLSAIHTVYKTNEDELNQKLAHVRQLSPACEILTTHDHDTGRGLIERLLPNAKTFQAKSLRSHSRNDMGTSRVTGWRKQFHEQSILPHRSQCSIRKDGYLRGDVPSWPADPVARIWVRR